MNTFLTYIFKHSYYRGVKEIESRLSGDLKESTKIWLNQNNYNSIIDPTDFNFLSLIYDNRESIIKIKTNLDEYQKVDKKYPHAVKFLLNKSNLSGYDNICYILSHKNIISKLNEAILFAEKISSTYPCAWDLYSKSQDISDFPANDIIEVLNVKEEFFSTKENVLKDLGNNKKIISLITGNTNYDFTSFTENTQILEQKALNFLSIDISLPKPIDKRLSENDSELLKKIILSSDRYGIDANFVKSYSIDDFYSFRKKLDSYGYSFDSALDLVQNNRSVIKNFNLERNGKSVVYIEDYYRVFDKEHPLYDIVRSSEQERLKRESLVTRVTFLKENYYLGFRILFGNKNPDLLTNESLLEICDKTDEIKLKHQEEKRQEDERERIRIQQQLERERQCIEQQKKDKCISLRNCITSWNNRIDGVPHFYLVDYYSMKDYGRVSDPSIWYKRKLVWNFKNDPQKGINPFDHESALQEVVSMISYELKNKFKDKCTELTLFCIPASTQLKTTCRYLQFSKQMHEQCGIVDSFNYVKVVEDGVAKHDGGSGRRTVEFTNHFFKDKYIIIFDDVVTSGSSMMRVKRCLEELGAFVVGCMSVGKTV